MNNNAKIMIVDDEESIRKLLQVRLGREGYKTFGCEDGAKALETAKGVEPTVIITDIKMPGLDGFQLIEELRKAKVECPIIMITGHGEKECAIEAIHKGAFDYLEKPFEMDEIAQVVKRAVESETMRIENVRLMTDLDQANKKLKTQLEVKTELLERVICEDKEDELLVGKSSHIVNLKNTIKTMAENFTGEHDPVVLITGESGVGKEMVARFIHKSVFENKHKSFVAVNCAAFPDNLLESELFGYEKGAFTGAMNRKLGLFELASGGTLFLDEIGEMDMKMQAKLLRALQERVIRRLGGTADIAVKPTIITATNRDLAKAVQAGTFREDLYYRLNTLPIAVAPLRSRAEDIEMLANYFLKKLAVGRGKKITGFSANALKAIASYRWPGNVRELKSVIERAVILEKGPVLELSSLRQESLHSASAKGNTGGGGGFSVLNAHSADSATPSSEAAPGDNVVNFPLTSTKSLSQMRKEMDEELVRKVLINAMTVEKGNVSSVARKLKLDRANLLRLMKRFDIAADLFRKDKTEKAS